MRLVTRVRQARIACPAGRGHRHFNNFAYQVAALTQRLRMQNDCAVRLRGKHIHLLYPQLSENKRLKKIGLKGIRPGKKRLSLPTRPKFGDEERTTCLRLVSI